MSVRRPSHETRLDWRARRNATTGGSVSAATSCHDIRAAATLWQSRLTAGATHTRARAYVARRKLAATVYFVGTVQEEVGLRGAHTAVAAINPDLGLSLEAGIAADHPGGRADLAQERLGGGPTIYLDDIQMFANLKLREFMEGVATKAGIPFQTEVTNGGSEDAAEIQRFGAGRPALNYAVPTRYLHSHNSMMQRSDLDQAITLLMKLLPELNATTVKEIARF